ncbi:MAG: nucleotide exchange factor GrpE [Steroidobacteraceae bacterium]
MNATDTERPEVVADGAEPAEDPTAAALRDAEARAEQHRADYLRAMAELENFRKRAAREIEGARQYGVERLAAELLPVADTLALALESAGSSDAATLIEGQRATLRLLHKAFERAGITVVDPAGQPFDPALHEAMAMRESAEHPPHTVLEVVQKGWLLKGRLLRPARVIVSATPATNPAPSGG